MCVTEIVTAGVNAIYQKQETADRNRKLKNSGLNKLGVQK